MPRKMVVEPKEGKPLMLTEEFTDEAQLQELVKRTPDLVPIEEFGMVGPMMVVGRETWLPSGAMDLVGLTQAGELLVIEFKTGPKNPDFRHALAQLLDYGSDLWSMPYEEFEDTVPLRYFASDRCDDDNVKGKASLIDAMKKTWPDRSNEEYLEARANLTRRLANGHFDYVVIAQRFTSPMLKTMEYLNESMPGSRFFAVELVKFVGSSMSVFETRTTLKPMRKTGPGAAVQANEVNFLLKIADDQYKASLQRIIDACNENAGLGFEWGSLGTSIRVRVQGREPVSIAWLFPPDRKGFRGMTDLTLGYDSAQLKNLSEEHTGLPSRLKTFVQTMSKLAGASQFQSQTVDAYNLAPTDVVKNVDKIIAAVVQVTNDLTGSMTPNDAMKSSGS